jgi:hypothetical protein
MSAKDKSTFRITAWLKSCALMTMMFFGCTGISAQELEYKMELGGMLGASFYLGDANYSTLYKNTGLGGGLMGRYNFNPRQSLKFNLLYGNISGDATKLKNKFPDIPEQKWSFDEPVVDLGCQYELGFWAYGTGKGYKGTKRLVPYIQFGLGFTYGGDELTMNIPFGFGVRYKLRERVNIGLDWTMRFSMSDKLDGISDPYSIPGGGLKNKDSYSFTMLYISYDLFPKYRKCNN